MRTVRRVSRAVVLLVSSLLFCAGVQFLTWFTSHAKAIRLRARAQQTGARWVLWVLGVKRDLDPAVVSTPTELIVSNHIGALDPLVLSASRPVSIIANAGMQQWPVIGWVARQLGVIFVERGRATSVDALSAAVEARLEADVPVVAFPEGTTTHGDRLLPFKTGVFVPLAGKAKSRILPVCLRLTSVEGLPISERQDAVAWAGGERSFAAYGWHLLGLRNATMRVRAGRQFYVKEHGRKALARRSHDEVLQLFKSESDASPPSAEA